MEGPIIYSDAHSFEFTIPADCTYKEEFTHQICVWSKVEKNVLRVEIVSVSTNTLLAVSNWLRVYTLAKQQAKKHFERLGLL